MRDLVSVKLWECVWDFEGKVRHEDGAGVTTLGDVQFLVLSTSRSKVRT